ncbi:hypothetical protein BGX24_011490, partial [Mortierella sp. AD032]
KAQEYISLEYVAMGMTLRWDEDTQRKKTTFHSGWNLAGLHNCSEFFGRRDNAIALVTGEPSDLIVVDCDIQKPKDLEAGIQCGKLVFQQLVQEKGLPEGTPVQKTASGGMHYFFSLSKSLENGLLSARNMIKICVNEAPYTIDTRGDGGCIIVAPTAICKGDGVTYSYSWVHPLGDKSTLPSMPAWCIDMLNACTNKASLEQAVLSLSLASGTSSLSNMLNDDTQLFVAQWKPHIEQELKCKIALPIRQRTAGFDFKCEIFITCLLCMSDNMHDVHKSNHYKARQVYGSCFSLRSYKGTCKTRVFNWEDNPVIRNILDYPATDIPRDCNINSIVNLYKKQYADNSIESLLNTNPDLIVARNGVIDLKTGILQAGQPEDYMTVQLDTDYNVSRGSKEIEDFMNDIFNNDQALIEYVQRLFGYGITGHSSEQCWAILTGDGSNGKSLFIGLLNELLGKWCVTAPYDIFFKSTRRAQAGGPTPHLSTLRGARICVKEETEPRDELNIEVIKIITGESTITSRGLYEKEYNSFLPTVLPILLCNHKPTINVDDDAMMRRVKVIPFRNIYTAPGDANRPYNPNHPRHRLRDPSKRKKLLTEECQEQLLVWPVQGAVKWYTEGLGEMPQAMVDAFNDYRSENDKLHEFIDEHCEVGAELNVNAGEFREAFKGFVGGNVQQKDLIEMMKKRGFSHGSSRNGKSSYKAYKGLCLKYQLQS